MKNIAFTLALLIVSIGSGYSRDANSLPLHCGEQRIIVPADMKVAKEGDRIFIIAGQENSSSEKNVKSYGIQLSGKGKNALSQPLIELYDVSMKRIIRKITLGEFYGKESNDWKALPKESSQNNEQSVSAYSFIVQGRHFKFIRTIGSISDEHLPGGHGATMSFAIVADMPMAISMRFIAGFEGASGREGNSCFFGDSASEQASRAMIVLMAKPAASITFEAKQKKGELNGFSIESAPVNLTGGEQTTLMSLTFTGTSVGQPEHAAKQAHNLATYLNSQSSNPDLVAVTGANQRNAKSGDTVVYTIEYHNIGTAAGKDIEINNPVPEGTRYLENSAEGDGGAVGFTRSGQSDVTAIQWKLDAPILPGEHRSVKFKVVVQ